MQRRLVPLLLACAPLFAQNEEDVAFSVAGRVVTPAGRACEGASVHLWDALADDRPLAHGTTNKEGEFKLEVALGAIARREHPFGPLRIEASQRGRARVGGRVRPGTRALRIVLPKPAKWTGVVRDPEGNPLPGAPVRAEQGELNFATTTDENGVYAFDEMGDGRIDLGRTTATTHATIIYLRAEGHAQRRIAAAAGEPVDLKLDKVPVGRGRIVDSETHEPLRGVRLVALDGSSPVEAISDSDGKFALEVEGRSGRVAAYRDGYAVSVIVVDVARGAEDHALPRAESVRGRVVDPEGGPIAFADVLLDVGFGDPISARCDDAGEFRFAVGVLDFARVSATRRGYLPGRATVDASWRADRVQVELPRGRRVTGTVEYDGSALLGAEVAFRGFAPPGVWKDYARVYTNARGEFRARAIPPGATHVVAITDDARSELTPIDDRVDLTVATRLPYSGIVVDDEGEPIEGVEIVVSGVEDGRALSDKAGRFSVPNAPIRNMVRAVQFPGALVLLPEQPVAGVPTRIIGERIRGSLKLFVTCGARRIGWSEVVLRSGAMVRRRWLRDGSKAIEFVGLAEGHYVVELNAPGYLRSRTELDLASSRKLAMQLERAGKLVLKAKAGARVVVQTLEGRPSPFVSKRVEQARDVVPGFGPGRYRIIARSKGENIVIREVTVGPKDEPREVDLLGGAASTLTVTVTGGDGRPLEGASIDLVTPGGFLYRTSKRTDAKGVATISRLILGPLRVVARHGESRADKGITIEPGTLQKLAIEFR